MGGDCCGRERGNMRPRAGAGLCECRCKTGHKAEFLRCCRLKPTPPHGDARLGLRNCEKIADRKRRRARQTHMLIQRVEHDVQQVLAAYAEIVIQLHPHVIDAGAGGEYLTP